MSRCLHFVPLRRFYDVLFVPLFCRPREKCGRFWKTTWLHNVDNIQQKDIKTFWNRIHSKTWRLVQGMTSRIQIRSFRSSFLPVLKIKQFRGFQNGRTSERRIPMRTTPAPSPSTTSARWIQAKKYLIFSIWKKKLPIFQTLNWKVVGYGT
jgi:hypothetical protein